MVLQTTASAARPTGRLNAEWTIGRITHCEFRIQILPLLAFGGALALAGLLWVKAVLPVSVEPLPDPREYAAKIKV